MYFIIDPHMTLIHVFCKSVLLHGCCAESSQLLGLALDNAAQTLYYTDSFLGVVARMKTDGTQRRELSNNIAEHPRAIIFDSTYRSVSQTTDVALYQSTV